MSEANLCSDVIDSADGKVDNAEEDFTIDKKINESNDSEKSFKSCDNKDDDSFASCTPDGDNKDAEEDKVTYDEDAVHNNAEETDDDDIRPGSCREIASSDEEASSWDEKKDEWVYDEELISHSNDSVPKAQISDDNLRSCEKDLREIVETHVSKVQVAKDTDVLEKVNTYNQDVKEPIIDKRKKDNSDPSVIPTSGKFYMHDSRTDDVPEKVEEKPKGKLNKKDEGRWQHDLYDSRERTPPHTRRGSNYNTYPNKSNRRRGKRINANQRSYYNDLYYDNYYYYSEDPYYYNYDYYNCPNRPYGIRWEDESAPYHYPSSNELRNDKNSRQNSDRNTHNYASTNDKNIGYNRVSNANNNRNNELIGTRNSHQNETRSSKNLSNNDSLNDNFYRQNFSKNDRNIVQKDSKNNRTYRQHEPRYDESNFQNESNNDRNIAQRNDRKLRQTESINDRRNEPRDKSIRQNETNDGKDHKNVLIHKANHQNNDDEREWKQDRHYEDRGRRDTRSTEGRVRYNQTLHDFSPSNSPPNKDRNAYSGRQNERNELINAWKDPRVQSRLDRNFNNYDSKMDMNSMPKRNTYQWEPSYERQGKGGPRSEESQPGHGRVKSNEYQAPAVNKYSDIKEYTSIKVIVDSSNIGTRQIKNIADNCGDPTCIRSENNKGPKSRRDQCQWDVSHDLADVIEEMPPLTEKEMNQIKQKPNKMHNPPPRFSRFTNEKPSGVRAQPSVPKRYSEMRSEDASNVMPSVDYFSNLQPVMMNLGSGMQIPMQHSPAHPSAQPPLSITSQMPQSSSSAYGPQMMPLSPSVPLNMQLYFIPPQMAQSRLNQFSEPFHPKNPQPNQQPHQQQQQTPSSAAVSNSNTAARPVLGRT